MFVPPDQHRSWQPPDRPPSKRSETLLLVLVGLFLLSMLVGPIAGGTLLQALPAMWSR